MHKTKNDIPEKVRVQVASLLQERLSDAVDLVTHAKQAHWNVKGPNFIALHELFDKVYEHAGDYADLLVDGVKACALTRYELRPPAGPPFSNDVAFDSSPFPK